MGKKFKFLDHVSDALVEAYGHDVKEAFENVALAMFEVMTDTKTVEPTTMNDITVEAGDLQGLLYSWLEELLIRFETEGILFSKFNVSRMEKTAKGYRLEAKAWGEAYNPEKHPSRTAIKAVTYHLMEVEEEKGKARVRVLFDL
jgi:SHS2 domain-containing protein